MNEQKHSQQPVTDRSPQTQEPDKPWWTYRMLWLVIGGPLVVVIASLSTAVVAIRGQDPVLTRDESDPAVSRPGQAEALTPAMQARNHAAQANSTAASGVMTRP